jgi:uncharacterized protein YxjI
MRPLGDGGNPVDNGSGPSGPSQRLSDRTLVRNARYRMVTGLAALEADFTVLNDAGEHVFRFNSRAMTQDDTVQIEDMRGHLLFQALAHSAQKQNRIAIVDGARIEVGSVVRQPQSPLRDSFAIEMQDGMTLAIDGNIPTHAFSIVGSAGRVAQISQRWFRARGSYGVEIEPGQQDALLLTAVAILDLIVQRTS